MRIGYSEEEDYPGQFNIFQANCHRSLKGKKGQASLRELEAALLALPAKRLIANELDNGTDCCAIGAVVRQKGIKPAYDPDGEMDLIGVECGMPRLVAWKVVEMNDITIDDHYIIAQGPARWPNSLEIGGGHQLKVSYTPEERYEAVLTWVRSLLKSA